MDATKVIEVREGILSANEREASALKASLDSHDTRMLNIMASPGSGKTTTILATIARLRDRLNFAVIEGDIESQVDSNKIKDVGIPTVQINTGGACHLDVPMVKPAVDLLALDDTDCIFVENIGNLVCPAEFDIGEAAKVMILSVPEGDDKILKYPMMFSVCDVLIVNKIDFLSLSTCNFDMQALLERMAQINPNAKIFPLSALTGEGVDEWCEWLLSFIKPLEKGE